MTTQRTLFLSFTALVQAIHNKQIEREVLATALFFPGCSLDYLNQRTKSIAGGDPLKNSCGEAWEFVVSEMLKAHAQGRVAFRENQGMRKNELLLLRLLGINTLLQMNGFSPKGIGMGLVPLPIFIDRSPSEADWLQAAVMLANVPGLIVHPRDARPQDFGLDAWPSSST